MNPAYWTDWLSDSQSVFAWRAGRAVTRADFAQLAANVAALLPARQFHINRCSSRYLFTLGLVAAALRGATCLLPGAAGAAAVAELQQRYPAANMLDDTVVTSLAAGPAASSISRELCAPDHVIAIAFTSGSTGEPRACAKTWRFLASSANYCREQVGGGRVLNLVATVPPQHMFGLEASVCTALAAGWAMFDGPSFLPAEVIAALVSLPQPRLLVTSPFHLRHLLASDIELPPVDVVLSATAPLSAELAREAEQKFAGVVQEIYGCTEAGSLGTRRTAIDLLYRPYPGLLFNRLNGGCTVTAPHLDDAVVLSDQLEFAADGRFELLGRDSDMVKVAGRRASLADITSKLQSLPGVLDAVVFVPADGDNVRPAALVVAPGQSDAQLRAALVSLMDPVFIPRPLRLVRSLPRNTLGKLLRAELLKILEQHRG